MLIKDRNIQYLINLAATLTVTGVLSFILSFQRYNILNIVGFRCVQHIITSIFVYLLVFLYKKNQNNINATPYSHRNRKTLQPKVNNICKSDVKVGDYADSL